MVVNRREMNRRLGQCNRCGGVFGEGVSEKPRCYSSGSCDQNLTDACVKIYNAAATELGADLGGFSVLDLCADQLPHVPLIELKAALVRGGFTQYQ